MNMLLHPVIRLDEKNEIKAAQLEKNTLSLTNCLLIQSK